MKKRDLQSTFILIQGLECLVGSVIKGHGKIDLKYKLNDMTIKQPKKEQENSLMTNCSSYPYYREKKDAH